MTRKKKSEHVQNTFKKNLNELQLTEPEVGEPGAAEAVVD